MTIDDDDLWWFVREKAGERRYVLSHSPACRIAKWTADFMQAMAFSERLRAERLVMMQTALGHPCELIEYDCRD